MKPRIPFLILLSAIGLGAMAEAVIDKTTRRKLRIKSGVFPETSTSLQDTIFGSATDSVRLTGYDKPLRSSQETMFAVNGTKSDIHGLIIECEYLDHAGRQLHKRTVNVKCHIPAGQTRQIYFRSWDRQQSFYYKLSTKPRRSQATPYDVRCSVKAIILNKATSSYD